MQINQVNLQSSQQMSQLKSFLERAGLLLDALDFAVVIKENNQIIACGGKHKNIIKALAVDPSFQHMGLLPQILTECTYQLFEQGYSNSFIFTTPNNQAIFESLNYQLVATTKDACLLEKGSSIASMIDELKATYQTSKTQNGAIVINGNPFTLGHQYLIETAAKACDRLFVFVVEEDASSFPFKDRFAMIQLGCAHLENVIILPSSFYIISQATFPNYFLRDKDHAFKTYAQLDVTIFGTWFSKLNIKTRFVGEEPLDPMTDLYNQTMKELLPSFGIKLTIIKRKENKDGIISASKVRPYLKADDFDAILAYVPDTTYKYLKQHPTLLTELKKYDGKH